MTTPATCTSRYRGQHSTYTCKRTPDHDGHHTDQCPAGALRAMWSDAMSLSVADVAEQAARTPAQRTDAERDQHRRTSRVIFERLARGKSLTPEEFEHLRRVTAAEIAENDNARHLAAGLATSAATYARRYEKQAQRTRKARAQRDATRVGAGQHTRAMVEHIAAGPLNVDVWARIGMVLGWTPERAGQEARRRRLHGEQTYADGAAEARKQLAESETNAHRLLQRAERAEARADTLARQLDAAHRRDDAADSLRWSFDLPTGQPPSLTVSSAAGFELPTIPADAAERRVQSAHLAARAEVAAAQQAQENAEQALGRRRAQLAQRLDLSPDTSWPDLFAAVGAHTSARQLAEKALHQSHADWRRAYRAWQSARARARCVQGWMAADLDTALGYAHHPNTINGGHTSWADWWADLLGEVRRRSEALPATDSPDGSALWAAIRDEAAADDDWWRRISRVYDRRIPGRGVW